MPAELLAVFSKRSDQIERTITAKVDDFRARHGREPNEWELGAIKREQQRSIHAGTKSGARGHAPRLASPAERWARQHRASR